MIDLIYNARYQALTILKNRGYSIPESLFNTDKQRINLLYNEFIEGDNENILNITIKNKKCIAKIVWIDKISNDNILEINKQFKNDVINFREELLLENLEISQNDNLIIITINNKKLIDIDYFIKQEDDSFINIENDYTSLFTINQLQFNLIDHILVPKHVLLNNKELINLKKKINYYPGIFPKIIRYANIESGENKTLGDPVARYYGLKNGDIVKIIRNIPELPKGGLHNTESVIYREVIDISNNKEKLTLIKFPNNIINITKDDFLDLKHTYFIDEKNSKSFSGYNLKEIYNGIQYSLINKDSVNLLKSLNEFMSFYILIFYSNTIIGNYQKNNKLHSFQKKILSKIQEKKNYQINNLLSRLNYLKSIFTFYVIDKTKKFLVNNYLSCQLLEIINLEIMKLTDSINNLENPNIFYRKITKLYNIFLLPNIKKTCLLINIIDNYNLINLRDPDTIIFKKPQENIKYMDSLRADGYDTSILKDLSNNIEFTNIIKTLKESNKNEDDINDLLINFKKIFISDNKEYLWNLLNIIIEGNTDLINKETFTDALNILKNIYLESNNKLQLYTLLNGLFLVLLCGTVNKENIKSGLQIGELSQLNINETFLPNYILGLKDNEYDQLLKQYRDLKSDISILSKENFMNKWLQFIKKNNYNLITNIDQPNYKEIINEEITKNIDKIEINRKLPNLSSCITELE